MKSLLHNDYLVNKSLGSLQILQIAIMQFVNSLTKVYKKFALNFNEHKYYLSSN